MRATEISCLLHTPDERSGLQPRPGIEPATQPHQPGLAGQSFLPSTLRITSPETESVELKYFFQL